MLLQHCVGIKAFPCSFKGKITQQPAVFGTFLGFSSAALLLIGESARRTVGIVYLNENKDKVCKYLSFKEIFLSNFFFQI